MKLKEYVQHLHELIALNPEALDYDVIYSADDEGNEYNKLNFKPSLMLVSNINEDRFLEILEEGEGFNTVCIN
jgi:hypothetical protein